jgi:hypothetical protein
MSGIQIIINELKRQFDVTVEVGAYAPGDGLNRFSVSVNNWKNVKVGLTRRECEIYVQGLYDILRVRRSEVRR